MLTKLLTRPASFPILVFLFFSALHLPLPAQDTIKQRDTLRIISPDTLKDVFVTDSLTGETFRVREQAPDSLKEQPKERKSPLKAKVVYGSKDSLRFDIKKQSVFLFNESDITYDDMNLHAAYVEINFPENMVNAHGMPDSTGRNTGNPEFEQAGQKFKSKTIEYNYNSKKGYIQTVITKQDEGYLHGRVVKKMENDITYIRDGSYTTCDLEEHPHFEFKFNKAKVIPGKRVITGPAYMVIADAPTPLLIPFGYFPNRTNRRSGIIVPTYGESANRGFFLENGGYYFALGDYFDLQLIGDIYSRGSWAIKPVVRYNYRYHYNGQLRFGYAYNRLGAADSPDFQESKDFELRWQHSQDPKARPHSRFSANVNIVSSSYNKYNPVSTQNYLSNTFQSSINYSTDFGGKVYLNMNFNHSQNTLAKTINFNFPQISLSVNQFYPFRKKNAIGKTRWFENISMKYNLDLQNQYNTVDSLLFKNDWYKQMRNGIQHQFPISGTFRILKYINWTNSISMTDVMYYQTISKRYVDETITGGDTLPGYYKTDTIYGFRNGFWGNISTGISTRVYGMYQFKKGPIIAFRHMLLPSVSFTYTPDFGAPWFGYYKTIENDTNTTNPGKYSIFQNGIYGSPPDRLSGVLYFSIDNNLEMKVRNRKDTVTGTRKIVLIDNLKLSASYDIAKDSVNWSPISLYGRTTLYKNLSLQYTASLDPYALNEKGQRTNSSEWKVNRHLVRLDNSNFNIGFNYSLSSEKIKGKKTSNKGTPEQQKDVQDYYDYYVDFDIPWSFSFNYSLNWGQKWEYTSEKRTNKVVQTLGFNGQLNITPKWKISLMTSYDFVNGKLGFTSIDVYRDLHCWEMRFGWIPKGAQKSWNFSINVKASILQDMKLNKKKDFRDYR